MSLNPKPVICPEGVWARVAEAAKGGWVHRVDTSPSKYTWTYRLPEDAAPTDNSEGVSCFVAGEPLRIPTSSNGIDIYIWSYLSAGSVRVDPLIETQDVYIQDQSSQSGDILLGMTLNSVTLASTVILDSKEIELEPGHSIVTGDHITIAEDSIYYQSLVVNVVSNVITVAVPVFYPFTAASIASRRTVKLELADGSTTPVLFDVGPPAGQIWDIYGVALALRDATAMDDALFAGAPALTNGCLFATKNGSTLTRFHFRSNSDMKLIGDFSYADKAPAGEYGLIFYKNMNTRNGVSVRLDGDLGEVVELAIQDDLTVLTYGRAMVSGHVVI